MMTMTWTLLMIVVMITKLCLVVGMAIKNRMTMKMRTIPTRMTRIIMSIQVMVIKKKLMKKITLMSMT